MPISGGFKPNNNTIRKIQKRADEIEEAFAKEFLKRVIDKTPVRTGALAAGWQMIKTRDGYTLTNEEDYAVPVEVGTPYVPPHAMVGRTAAEAPEIMKKAVKETK